MRMNFALSLLAAVTMTSQMSFAKKENKMAKETAATTYKLDTQASNITWTGTKATGSSHTGTISFKEGQVEMMNGGLKAGNFVVAMSTLSNKDLAGSPKDQAKLEGHLKSADFFNVEKYPEATFKITSVAKKSDTEATVKGDLTMIGSTQPIEFPATMKIDGNKVTGTADLKIDRTKWGLKYGSGQFFKGLGDKVIKDEIDLKLNLTATK